MSEDVRPWWQHAVIYQVYPRSFADSDHDGVGDLSGIAEKLDHIRALGADAVWISPVYRSPMADAGYDISDHCDIDPVFGTLADMDVLIEQAHARGLRVLLDFVPNHTSEEHPWFRDARSSRDSPRRDWYIWRDEPNNWRAALDAGSAWTWDASTEQYYLHLFLPAQPDLNWRNPEVVDAMHGVLRFWLDRGVDGLDAGDVPKEVGMAAKAGETEKTGDFYCASCNEKVHVSQETGSPSVRTVMSRSTPAATNRTTARGKRWHPRATRPRTTSRSDAGWRSTTASPHP